MTDSEKRCLIELLDTQVMKAVPRATKVSKYGGTLYTLKPDEKEGQFCGVFPYKDHVQLSFANGSELDDPDSVLQGNGKFRRHINFDCIDDVDAKVIRRLCKAAAKR